MIRRIELTNFMSHAHTVIEPADGLTVLVGPNNCGKSAVVAALQILCHNEASTYVTRHHERECAVRVETDDGHVVEWRRKNSPRYIIDGEDFDRLGRSGVPDGLHNVLRLPKVTAEGNQDFDIHFGEQKSPVFLLDKPGSHAAQFFASSSDAASLVEIQKRHQQKMADARRERAQLQVQDEKLRSDLAFLAVTDDISLQLEQAEARYEELTKAARVIDQLSHNVQSLKQAVAMLHHHHSEVVELNVLSNPPILTDPKPLADTISAIIETRRGIERGASCIAYLSGLEPCPELADDRSLAGLLGELCAAEAASVRTEHECLAMRELSSPPVLDDTKLLRTVVKEIEMLQAGVKASSERCASLEYLNSVPVLNDEYTLRVDIDTLSQAKTTLNRAEFVHRHLDALSPLPTLIDTDDIEHAVQHLCIAADTLSARSEELEQANRDLDEAGGMLRVWAERQQRCPTCGNALDPEQIIAHADSCTRGTPHA